MSVRAMGGCAVGLVAAFLLVAAAAQGWRSDLDPLRAPLSAYLVGPGGAVVQAAYFALAMAMLLLAVGMQRALVAPARSVVPAALLAFGALALAVTALANGSSPEATFVHGVAAPGAFLATATALPLQGWRFRFDPQWRAHTGGAFAWGLLAFAALWAHALWRDGPRGLTQKAVIVLIVVWLGWAGWRLWRGAR